MAEVANVIVDIEKTLKLEKLPARNPQPDLEPQQPHESSEIARLFHLLKQFAKKQEEEAAIDPKDKAFIAYAKAALGAYVATFNSLNLIGIVLSYIIGHHSDHLNNHPNMHMVFIGMSLAFLPFSLLIAGLAHSLEDRIHWINRMAYALIAEVLYMFVMCAFWGYYLIDFSTEFYVVLVVIVTTVSLLFPHGCGDRTLLDLCKKPEADV